jgi:hypothetical protein
MGDDPSGVNGDIGHFAGPRTEVPSSSFVTKASRDTMWADDSPSSLFGDSVRRRFPFPFPLPLPFAPPEGDVARVRLGRGRRLRPSGLGGGEPQ